MNYNKIKNLMMENLQDELFYEIIHSAFNTEELYKLVNELFADWDFDVIEKLQANNIIAQEYVDNLILKNNNLSSCIYMLKSLSNDDAIISNIDNLIKYKMKNIHTYNLILGILRTMIISSEISLEKKEKITELYLKYADLDNLLLCIVALEDDNEIISLMLVNHVKEMFYERDFLNELNSNNLTKTRKK